MSIAGLIRRLVKGSPLTAADHDGNLDALEAAIEAVETTPGPAGAAGPPGTAATITVGTVTTGEPGTSATVTNTGTSSAAVFAFTIPRGNTGDQGPTGAKGDTGNTGSPGAAATIAVGTVTTGAAGSSATVTNVGTSAAAVLNFTIPAGATGPQGATGPAGTTTWAGITDKPSTFAPSTHGSSHQTGGADAVPTVSAEATQLTGTTNDWTPPVADVVFLSASVACDLTGAVLTRPVSVNNVGSFAITLKHQSASSAASNRFVGPDGTDVVLAAGKSVLLVPRAAESRIRIL